MITAYPEPGTCSDTRGDERITLAGVLSADVMPSESPHICRERENVMLGCYLENCFFFLW